MQLDSQDAEVRKTNEILIHIFDESVPLGELKRTPTLASLAPPPLPATAGCLPLQGDRRGDQGGPPADTCLVWLGACELGAAPV